MTDYDELTESQLRTIYEIQFEQRYPDESLLLRRVLKLRDALKKANARIAELEAQLAAPQENQQ